MSVLWKLDSIRFHLIPETFNVSKWRLFEAFFGPGLFPQSSVAAHTDLNLGILVGVRSEMQPIHGHADSTVGAVTLSRSQKFDIQRHYSRARADGAR